jgi:aspartyl-tRNA(Asn)/glutamyl-tRNA(Gln) amidotransferase subunit B
VIHELGGLFSKADVPWSSHRIPSDALAFVISMVQKGSITIDSAKKLVSLIFEGDTRNVQTIAEQENLLIQEIADDEYFHIAQDLINENSKMVKAIKEKSQHGKIMWFVGQAMKSMSKSHGGGGVRPEKAKEAILKALDLPLDTIKANKK